MSNREFTVSKVVDQKTVTEVVSVVTEGCYYFFNAQHLYFQLTAIERSYFDFMCEKMDYEYRIGISNVFRKEYIEHYYKITSLSNAPSETDLRTFEKKLIALKLVINLKGQSIQHIVNPKYVMKGKLTQRKNKLQELSDMASKGKIDIRTIYPKPVDELPSEPPQ